MLTESSGLPDSQGPALGPGVELNGRYVLEGRLEHGRIGVVYKALDKHRSDAWGEPQHVALLVVPPHAVRGPLLDPFKQAFAAVRLLRHPRIAAIYDFEAAGETFFLTMEYVDGESLRSVIDMLSPETLSRDEAWRVVAAVGEALLYAHEAGVVHGDVRAENVVVAARGQIKMLFSPACIAASAPFVADEPEDVYGLAELAYELLAGQKPPADALLSSRRRIQASRIDGLSRGQWKALQAGLAGREERTRSVGQLLAALDLERGARKTRKASGEPRERALAMRDSGRMPILGPAEGHDGPVHPYVRPTEGYDRPADRDDRNADREDRPADREDRHADRDDRNVDRDDRHADRDDRSVDRDDRHADRDDRSVDRDDRSADRRHADRDDRHAGSHDQPADRYVHPADDYDWSEDGYDRPSQGYDRPAQGYDRPSRGYDRPAQGYEQNVETSGRSHAGSSPWPSSTPTSPFPARPPEPSSTPSAKWPPAAPSAPAPHPSMAWPRPGGAGLPSGEFATAARRVPPPLPMPEFRQRAARSRPRLARRLGASVVIMAAVLTAALALLRYGPMEIGRRAGATSVVALDAVRQHVLEPASRGVTGFVRAARERTAPGPGAPRGAGATNAGSADENGAAGDGAAGDGAADDVGAAPRGAAPASGAADAPAPGAAREPPALVAAERAPDASNRESGGPANALERESDAAPAVEGPESVGNASERPRAGAEGAAPNATERASGTERAAESADRGDGDGEPRRSVAALPEGTRPAPNGAGANAAGPAASVAAPSPSVAAPAPSAAASATSATGTAVYFTARELTASEGQTVVPVEIARNRAGSETSVLWWTADETATAGNDYADLGGVIETFEPGQTSRTVFIPITNDSLSEGRETFVVYLALQSADGKPRNEPQRVRVTIVDDDF